MKLQSKANFETRCHLQGIRNIWRRAYPNMTEYQIMKRLLTSYSKD